MGSGGGYGSNMFAFLGMGWSYESRINTAALGQAAAIAAEAAKAEENADTDKDKKEADRLEREAAMKRIEAQKEDVSPYLDSGMVDYRWLVAKEGMSEDDAKELIVKRAGEKAMAAMRKQIARMDKGEVSSCLWEVSAAGWVMLTNILSSRKRRVGARRDSCLISEKVRPG